MTQDEETRFIRGLINGSLFAIGMWLAIGIGLWVLA